MKKHETFLAKSKLNSINVLIFKSLSDSYISRGEFFLLSNVLKEYENIKK